MTVDEQRPEPDEKRKAATKDADELSDEELAPAAGAGAGGIWAGNDDQPPPFIGSWDDSSSPGWF